jgi:hypothetical protein
MTLPGFINMITVQYSLESNSDLCDWTRVSYEFYDDSTVRIIRDDIFNCELLGITTVDKITESTMNTDFKLPNGHDGTIQSTMECVTTLNDFINTHFSLVKAACIYT